MSTEKDKTAAGAGEEGAAAVEAAAVESAAKAEQDKGVYTHKFNPAFTFQGITHESLTFNWGSLTGADHLAIENELLMRGKTLITPEFTGEFLCGMAVRACTDRTPDGFRVLDQDAMKALPLRDFQTICKRARAFLLRAGS